MDAPLITDKSPLLLLPDNVDPAQKRCLEGMRVAMQFVDVSYHRLRSLLISYARSAAANSPSEHATLMLDAWTVIDATERLRGLVQRLKHYSSRAPSKEIFLRSTASVTGLRNAVQHLDGEVSRTLEEQVPLHGALTWAVATDPGRTEFVMGALRLGALAGTDGLRPLVRIPEPVTDDVPTVVLHAAGCEVDLTVTHGAVGRLAGVWERTLRKQFPNATSTLNDLMIQRHVHLGESESGAA
ncbi:MAG: hypothetical protein IPK85_04630 [Gemmatimonadetes bacterium]|nr:hypothetical protein [Gemmatimonadota bacterium]